jgi:hypothetical protein
MVAVIASVIVPVVVVPEVRLTVDDPAALALGSDAAAAETALVIVSAPAAAMMATRRLPDMNSGMCNCRAKVNPYLLAPRAIRFHP